MKDIKIFLKEATIWLYYYILYYYIIIHQICAMQYLNIES